MVDIGSLIVFGRQGSDLAREEVLEHYASVVQGRALPMFLYARQIALEQLVDLDGGDISEMETTALLEYHSEACKVFLEEYERTKAGKIPRFSLLDLKIELAKRLESPCMLCENRCGALRSEGERGDCGVLESKISSHFVHMGEEPELIPSYTIFFAGCNLSCVYCQNWDISQRPETGIRVKPGKMARIIDDEYGSGIRNVNWVGGDPTPNLSYILKAMAKVESPLAMVWNSNMYLGPEALQLLCGVIDLYLTDFKYGNNECGKRLSKVDNYFDVVLRNHKKVRQWGDVIVRHLVLPGHLDCCTGPVLDALSDLDQSNVKVNVMDQYRPEHLAEDYPEIAESLAYEDFQTALEMAKNMDLNLAEGSD